MYQVSNISKLLTLISFRTDNFGGKIGRVIIFKMVDCTQRNLSKLTRKLTVILYISFFSGFQRTVVAASDFKNCMVVVSIYRIWVIRFCLF